MGWRAALSWNDSVEDGWAWWMMPTVHYPLKIRTENEFGQPCVPFEVAGPVSHEDDSRAIPEHQTKTPLMRTLLRPN
jgi:hypothetical protein